MRITAYLSYKFHDYTDRIKFENSILVDKERKKGENILHYKLKQWKKIGSFDILKNISEHVMLLQFM